MKNLKLSNKIFFSIIFILILIFKTQAEDKPIDIWNIEKDKIDESLKDSIEENNEVSREITESEIYKMQNQKQIEQISLEKTLNTQKINIYGLFDPEDNGLDIDMWSNSNGDELKNIFSRLDKIDLSEDASDLMKIALLTNAHSPNNNISEKEFLQFRSNWLMKNSDLDLIEEYLIKNQIV